MVPQVLVFSLAVFYFDNSVLNPAVMNRELLLSGRQVVDSNISNLYSHCVVRYACVCGRPLELLL